MIKGVNSQGVVTHVLHLYTTVEYSCEYITVNFTYL